MATLAEQPRSPYSTTTKLEHLQQQLPNKTYSHIWVFAGQPISTRLTTSRHGESSDRTVSTPARQSTRHAARYKRCQTTLQIRQTCPLSPPKTWWRGIWFPFVTRQRLRKPRRGSHTQ
ncbi:uncharacterized protein FMAN_14089 [Fusarium mangiferae]|uniref:Uncharacterized protein n=1 Tax=Fusarium mangiferae TaxID=192010 RepID=A0A1L7UDU4_FUSMA|nr:uncharacterized protein FMAN_14089 [Fusarium mangiferae]CVL08844.1 uncharacterized protein FMAN_14089 [Fusarium mangiferae]